MSIILSFIVSQQKINITIFASGSGSNAENIIKYSRTSESSYAVSSVMCNKREAYVLRRAEYLKVPSIIFTLHDLQTNSIVDNGEKKLFTKYLSERKIDFIILAGFLLQIPPYLTEIYDGRILNIHPALLPKYGGKGMYGAYVHEAVIRGGESVSGITIHSIDNDYDKGTIVYQSKCPVVPEDTPETLAAKIHKLEKIYPSIINKYIKTYIKT